MKFDMRRPCAHCPFRNDIRPYLTPARVKMLFDDLNVDGRMGEGKTFQCHETTGVVGPVRPAQQCGGALAMMERAGVLGNNQMFRIAMRLGLLNPDAIDTGSPVYESPRAMMTAHRRSRR